MAEEKVHTKVFISYSQDSFEHKERVLELANMLRVEVEVDADIDIYVRAKEPFTPKQGWDIWMQEKIEWAEFVLIVCTETYKRRFDGQEEPGQGLGVLWEAKIIRQNIYNQRTNTKFIPIVFSSSDLVHVPVILDSGDKYRLDNEQDRIDLYSRLRKKNTIIKPEIGKKEFQSPSVSEYSTLELPLKLNDVDIITQEVGLKSLKRDRGIDYTMLYNLLVEQEWKKADEQTWLLLCQVAGKEEKGILEKEDIKNFSCEEFKIINQLWLKLSEGKLGFSVQMNIYKRLSKIETELERIKELARQVGWLEAKENGWYDQLKIWKSNTHNNQKVNVNASDIPSGYLPICIWWQLGTDDFNTWKDKTYEVEKEWDTRKNHNNPSASYPFEMTYAYDVIQSAKEWLKKEEPLIKEKEQHGERVWGGISLFERLEDCDRA